MIFNIGEYLVYPMNGVGIIQDIFDLNFNQESVKYCALYIESTDMVFKLPLSNMESLGIRKLSSQEEAQAALDSIHNKPTISFHDWKTRHQKLATLLKQGTLDDMVYILHNLHVRSVNKELPVQEKKIYDLALSNFIAEVSIIFSKPSEDIHQIVFKLLNQSHSSDKEKKE